MSYNLPEPYVPISRRLQDADIKASTLGRSSQLDTHFLAYSGKLYQKAERTHVPSLEAVSAYLNNRSIYMLYETTRIGAAMRPPLFGDDLKDTLPTVLRRAGLEVGSIAGDVDRRIQSVVASLKVNPKLGEAQAIPVSIAMEKQARVFSEWANDLIVGIANKLDAPITPVVHETALYVANVYAEGVLEWPIWRPVSGSIDATIGQTVIIKPIVCGADTGIWFRNDDFIGNAMEWVIPSVGLADAGTYYCVYSNDSRGTRTPDFVLNVT